MKASICAILFAVWFVAVSERLLAADHAAKAQKLVEQAVMAMGGPEALEKSRYTVIQREGTYFGMGQGVSYKGRDVFSFADPVRIRMEIQGIFVLVKEKNKAWVTAGENTLDLEGKALEVAKQDVLVNYALSLLPLRQPNKAFKLSLVEAETIEGDLCEGILVEHEKMPAITIHFSKKTGLMTKAKFVTQSEELNFKNVVEEMFFYEYRKFDGLIKATDVTTYRDGRKFLTSRATEITFPKTVDHSEFEKPQE